MKDYLTQVFDALKEKGYNPINQIVGYILSKIQLILLLITTQEVL